MCLACAQFNIYSSLVRPPNCVSELTEAERCGSRGVRVSAFGEKVKRVVRVGWALVSRTRPQLSGVPNICWHGN